MFSHRREHLARTKATAPTTLGRRGCRDDARRRLGPTTTNAAATAAAQTSPASRARRCGCGSRWVRARLAPRAQSVPYELPKLGRRAEPVQAIAPARRLAYAGQARAGSVVE